MILNMDKIVIGYDLADDYAQITYSIPDKKEPETLSLSGDAKHYNIPVCLFKRSEVNQWFFGKEAHNYAMVEEGTLFDSLLERAVLGQEIEADGEKFDPVALLALFIKRSLSLMSKSTKKMKPGAIMFTVPALTPRVIEVMKQMSSLLDIKDCEVYFQGREESIYNYVINQQQDLWRDDVVVYDFTQEKLRSYRFIRNIKTTPVVAFVENTEHDLKKTDGDLDEGFLKAIRESLGVKKVSSVYLIGEGFSGEWCQESLKELCQGRRVFKGNNLFGKGACFAAGERYSNQKSETMVFLGKDKLKANIGMKVKRGWEESYLALLDGGENWYESRKECQIILDTGNSFPIWIIPLDGRNAKTVEIVLEDLPVREDKKTRLFIKAFMIKEDCMQINIKDMGFGEYVKSSGMEFQKQINLS